MTLRTSFSIGALVMVLGLASRDAVAEVIGPQLPAGKFEVGLQKRYVERKQYASDGLTTVLDEHDLAITVRWGVTEFATVSIEGITGTSSAVSGYDDIEQFYLIGGAMQATLWRDDRFLVSAGLQYTETFRRWNTAETCDQGTGSLAWEVMVQTDFDIKGQRITPFAGPAYSEADLFILGGIDCHRLDYDSDRGWGGVVGVEALLAGHITINGHLLWTENMQPRFGLGYRF